MMTENQKIRIDLLNRFSSVCEAKKAYEFVMGDEEAAVEAKDGVYIIYDNGSYAPFTGGNPKENIKSVGVVFQGHSFAVALNDLPKKYALVRDIGKCERHSPLYKGEIDSIFDWDVEAYTKHIVEAGTDIPLKDGELIPTAAMLVAMYRLREGLNKALVYAGGEALKTDDYYWSSSETSAGGSWCLYFSNGYLNYYYKYIYGYVRPCMIFELCKADGLL